MNHDIDTLTRTLYGEAEAEDREDAEAIAAVVTNRMRYPNWPDGAAAVCLQPWQFSCWNPGDPNRDRITRADEGEPWFKACREVAAAAITGRLADRTDGATHYHADYIRKPKWAQGHEPCHVTRGGRHRHLFYNDIDTPPPSSARDALDRDRPLAATRTVKGAQAATAGIGLSALADAAADLQSGIEPLVPYLDTLKWVFVGVALIGIGITVWARLADREQGLR